ncbi:hypothetical protein [Butyrivibrio sp. YAB3001]|uniref:hypothetical protein n=1 Tax=Butyrivibrio sp. YAB3001 TaxID=1520812 RepID=UPI0008F6272D|nr:hypothetical protein [Butyrivibrio sp. YAB3001]SFC03458.1 hypothetical protein SAMN02910398_01383 [Butyrivibrio sp. YAB3001]
MRKKTLLLAFSAAFILSACGSNSTTNTQEDSADEASSAISIEAAEESASIAETLEDNSNTENSSEINGYLPSSATDYKQAYKEIIKYEQERLASVSPDDYDEYEDTIDCYWLYDIDKDNTPELLIRYGHCEATFHGKLYTFIEGKLQLIDGIGMGHTSFYAVPDENGILSYWGHMGYGSASKLTLQNGLLESEELYSEDINEKLQNGDDAWYKAANEIIEGAYYLEAFNYYSTYPIEMYDVVADYSSGNIQSVPTSYSFPDNNPDFYTDIMQNDVIVSAVALDQFMNTPGEVPFSMLLEPGQIYEYTHSYLNVHGLTYADLNSDGIYECIFYLSENEQNKDYRAILSLQDRTVYAYLTFYPGETTITEDGYFVSEPGEYTHERYVKRVLYDKENGFTYAVPSEQ